VGFANPNDLGAWFGFCSVYFMVLGIETRRNIIRCASLIAAAGYVFVVGLTVSRTSFMAVGIAAIVALRHVFYRGFVPALLLATLSSVILFSGLFDHIIASYEERGTEDSGRLEVWPLAIERFLASPLSGVGTENVGTAVADGRYITPHNIFLYVGLSA